MNQKEMNTVARRFHAALPEIRRAEIRRGVG
jgi:hypothetical protein